MADMTPDPDPSDRLDTMFEALQPRMHAHKRSYLRMRFGAVLAAPLLLVGGTVYASSSDRPMGQLANGGAVTAPAPDVVQPAPAELPMVDLTETDLKAEAEAKAADATKAADEIKATHDDKQKADEIAKADALDITEEVIELDIPADDGLAWQTVALGDAGTAEIGVHGEKYLELGEVSLSEGWEAVEIEGKDRYVVLMLTKGDTKLIVTLKMQVKSGEMKVVFDDLDDLAEEQKKAQEAKAAEEAEAKKAAEAPNAPAVTASQSYSTTGGSVYVSMSGSTVSISVTGTNGGWTSEMVQASGSYAKVRFINADRTVFTYVMGQFKDGKLVVGEWTENFDYYEDQGKDDKKNDDKKNSDTKKKD